MIKKLKISDKKIQVKWKINRVKEIKMGKEIKQNKHKGVRWGLNL